MSLDASPTVSGPSLPHGTPDLTGLTLNLSGEYPSSAVPPYPGFRLLKAQGGEVTYELSSPDGKRVEAIARRAKAGEVPRGMDMRFVPDWRENILYRARVDRQSRNDPQHRGAQLVFCRANILYWINVFVWTYDPRLRPARRVPMVTYPIQDQFVSWVISNILNDRSGLAEKSREMGVSWLLAAVETWLAIFHEEMSGYLMSMHEIDVDDRTTDSLLGKCRYIIGNLPEWMRGGWEERSHGSDLAMQITIPTTRSIIKGILSKSTAARGGRSGIVVADEFAFVEDTDAVLRALSSLSNCKIYASTANGMSNAFYRMAKDPRVNKFRLHWTRHPLKNAEWAQLRRANPEMTDEAWASEMEIDYAGSTAGRVYPQFVSAIGGGPWVHLKQDQDSFWQYDPRYEVLTGQDYGIADMTFIAFVQRKPAPPEFRDRTDETWVFFDEEGATDTAVDEWRWVLNQKGYRYGLHVGDDRTGNQRQSDRNTWVTNFRRNIERPVYVPRAGRVIHPGPPIIVRTKRNSVSKPIQTVQRYLNIPGAIAVNAATCPRIVEAFQNWSYPTAHNPVTGQLERIEDVAPEHDVGGYSHVMWAVAYLMEYVLGGYQYKKRESSCKNCGATAPHGTPVCPVCGDVMIEAAWDFPAPRMARL